VLPRFANSIFSESGLSEHDFFKPLIIFIDLHVTENNLFQPKARISKQIFKKITPSERK
jgi:hypothetical protein